MRSSPFRTVPVARHRSLNRERNNCCGTVRTEALVDFSVEPLHEFLNDPEPPAWTNILRSRSIIRHETFRGNTALPQFNLDDATLVGKCVSRGVCDKFGYDQTQFPALHRTQ